MLKGASGLAAEIAFHLSLPSDPITPVTGHVFTAGEVLVWLPSTGSYADANTAHIVEKGFGDYALQLTSTDSSVSGTVYLYVNSSAAQPFRAFDFIVDPLNPGIQELPFALIPSDDPVYGDGSGHSFTLGEVQFLFSGGSYEDVPVDQILERGNSTYGVVLTSPQRLALNSVYLAAQVSGMSLFTASYDMLGNPGVIFLETSGLAAEIPFHLTNSADGVSPVTGQTFGSMDAMVWWPSAGVFAPVSPSSIVEKGFGDYAVQGTSLNTLVAGTAYLYVSTAGALPVRQFAFVTNAAAPAPQELPFTLLPISNPVLGNDTGQSFTLGQVQLMLSGLPYANVPLTKIAERGFSMYAVVLTTAQQLFPNQAYIYASVSSEMPYSADWGMMSSILIPTPPPSPVVIPGVTLPAGPYLNKDVRSGGTTKIIPPTGTDLVAMVAANITANLRAAQDSQLTLPSGYKLAYLIAHATDEIAETALLPAPPAQTQPVYPTPAPAYTPPPTAGAGGPYLNRDVRSLSTTQIIPPTGQDIIALVATNVTANLLAQQDSQLTLPSGYKLAYLVAHETDEIAVAALGPGLS
jgi:hypothetical protein